MGGERQATLTGAPATRLLLLVAVRPELLEVGPKVGDVLVVLYADEGHSRAGHLLHRSTDVFRERFVVPGDPGPLVGRGIIEALETAGLAAVDGVERRPKLDFGRFADVVAGGATTLEHLLAGSGILRQGRARRSCKSNPSNHPRPHHFLPFPDTTAPVSGAGRPETERHIRQWHRLICSDPVFGMASNCLQVNRPRGQFVSPPRRHAYFAEWRDFVPRCRYKYGVTSTSRLAHKERAGDSRNAGARSERACPPRPHRGGTVCHRAGRGRDCGRA